jgi:hypothetical protein
MRKSWSGGMILNQVKEKRLVCKALRNSAKMIINSQAIAFCWYPQVFTVRRNGVWGTVKSIAKRHVGKSTR